MGDDAGPSLSQRGGRALSWTFFGTMLRAFIQFVLLIVLTRLLLPEDFGVMALAEASVFMAYIFSSMGVGPFLIQRKEIGDRQITAAFTLSLISSTLFTAALVLASGPLETFFNKDGLGPIILVMSVSVFLMTMAAVPESLLMRRLEFRAVALTDLAAYGIGYGLVGLVLALNGAGVWSLVAGFVAQDLIRAGVMYYLRPPPLRLFINVETFKEFIRFGGGIILGSIFNQLAQQLDRIVAGRFLGAADLGFYARSHQLLILPASLFGKVVERVLFPVMSSIQGEEQRLAKAFLRATATTAILTMPFSAVVCILAPEIISLLFGAGWSRAVQPLQVLSLAIPFRIGYKTSDSLSRAKGAVYRRAWRQFVFAAMMLVGSLFGAKYYGLTGVAIGTSAAVIGNYFFMTDLSCRILKISYANILQSLHPAIFLTIVSGISGFVASNMARSRFDSDIIIFMITASVMGLVGLFAVLILPRLFLGQDGYWVYQVMRKNFTLRA